MKLVSSMAEFQKELIAPGAYQTPDGPAIVTPERIKHWFDQFQEMKKEGVRVPMPWGHQPDAEPASETAIADHQYWKSRYNAGNVKDLVIGQDGILSFKGEGPGLEVDAKTGDLVTEVEKDGVKLKTSIGEVSLGCRDWIDGRGKKWEDALIHVALTPLPIWQNQGNFQQLSTLPGAAEIEKIGSHGILYRFATEEKPMDEDKGPPEGGEKEKKSEKPEKKDCFKECISGLQEKGISLPDDTEESNFCERLWVALHAINNMQEDEPAETTPPPEPAEKPLQEEQGTFMSTISNDPVKMMLLSRVMEADKKERLAKIDGLSKRGAPAHVLKKLRAAATTVQFSTDARGRPLTPEIDKQIALLDETLPPADQMMDPLWLSTVREEAQPEDEKTKHKDVADELAENAGFPARKKN